MEVFLKRSLVKIRKMAKSATVKASCDAALETLKSSSDAPGNALEYFEPLKLACESQQAALMQEALDCVQKLIAYGYLRGASRGGGSVDPEDEVQTAEENKEGAPEKASMDAIVTTVCKCDDFDDDNVQLQVIKALLTAVTSNTCEIHEGSLLLAVRSCYNIQLVTRSTVNRTTAKATLTQMLSIVFQRMEAHEQRIRHTQKATSPKSPMKKNKVQAVDSRFVVGDAVAVPGFGDGELRELRDDGSCVVALAAWRLPNGAPALLYAKAAVLEEADAEGTQQPRLLGGELPAGASLREDGALVVDDDDEESGEEESEEEEEAGDEDHVKKRRPQNLAAATPFASSYHKDAFLLFRALCKLSMKGHDYSESEKTPEIAGVNGAAPSAGVSADPISMQSKVLSLELLLSVLEHSGDSFRSGARFIGAVRQYLCVSLLKNCTSSSTTVVALSLRIFVALIVKLREHLKAEVEVFISHIFLRILDSDNSTLEHKILVLDVFHNLCADPRSLVEIFLSYDADFDSMDIFRSIVVALAKVVKGSVSSAASNNTTTTTVEPQRSGERRVINEAALRRVALSGLIATLKSLATSSQIVLDNTDPSQVAAAAPNGSPQTGSLRASLNKRELELRRSNSGDSVNGEPIVKEKPSANSVESFDLKQRIQEDLRDGILQFNMNPKKGLKLLAAKGHLENEPESVARFLQSYGARLNKTVVGEYLGREKDYQNGFCVAVLHAFVDQMDFRGMEFDMAIRHFLAGFRLPGEAQKIDRMMEKFAERFCAQNPKIFPSADVAFVLAFSVIMLQTDLHNPAVKEEKKMTKDGFRRNNRGIANGEDLPAAFLDDIFDRIKATPITLKEDVQAAKAVIPEESLAVTLGFAGPALGRRRAEAFHREREDMVKASVSLLRQGRQQTLNGGLVQTVNNKKGRKKTVAAAASEAASSVSHQYVLSEEMNAVAAAKMFEVAWGPALSAFSHALEHATISSNSAGFEQTAAMALDGLTMSACVAASLGLEVARDALVNALASFTNLYKRGHRNLEQRHVACIDALLSLARHEDCAESLCDSWLVVLQVASRVAHLRLVISGLHTDDAFFAHDANASDKEAQNALNARTRDAEDARALAMYSKLSDSDLESIYARSTQLTATGVEHFVTQLCAVSMAELATGDGLETSPHVAAAAAASRAKAAEKLADPPVTTLACSSKPDADSVEAAAQATSFMTMIPTTTRPRVYSLGRLVDVADANVATRPRLAWDRIWRVLAEHFERAGAHSNADVAKYALDALRQLSLKFLSVKDELRDFKFQRLFLRPFEVVLARANQPNSGANRAAVREYVVRCVDALVRARYASIRSGWRCIFSVYSAAADDADPSVAELAYASLEHVAKDHLDLVAHDFVELVNCVVAFAAAPKLSSEIALGALDRLDACSLALADGRVSRAISVQRSIECKEEIVEEAAGDAQLELWWPLLLGLAQRVADPRLVVRNRAMAVLRGILERDCEAFSSETWRLVFRGVLFPSLESAWTDDAALPCSARPTDAYPRLDSNDESSWLASTAPQVLEACVALYSARDRDAVLLGEMLALLGDCLCQDVEALTRLAVGALTQTLEALPRLTSDEDEEKKALLEVWETAALGLCAVVERALPQGLLVFLTEEQKEEDKAALLETIAASPPDALMAKLVASLQLQPLCSHLLVAASSSSDSMLLSHASCDALLEALSISRDFARRFNASEPLRAALGPSWALAAEGSKKKKNKGVIRAPELIAQHVGGGEAAIAALSHLAETSVPTRMSSSNGQQQVVAHTRLLDLSREILTDYSSLEKADSSQTAKPPEELLTAYTPLALDALKYIRSLDGAQFKKHALWLVPVLSELIVCKSIDLRTAVAHVFASNLPSALSVSDNDVEAADPPHENGAPPRRSTPGAVVKPYRLFES